MFFKKGDINQKEEEKLEWKRGEKTKVNRFMDSVGVPCGLSEKDLFEKRKKRNSIGDAIWSLSQECILNIKKERVKNIKDLDKLISIYIFMAIFLQQEGKNANHIMKKKFYYDLLRYKEQGCEFVIPICVDDACSACKKIDGMEFNIDEAIKTQPFPPENCQCLRCTIAI
jgi:hypothetical protein